MRSILIIFTLFLLSFISNGQEHLEPATGFSFHSTSAFRGLLPKLTKGFKNPIVQYIVLPSFSPEYALSLEKSHRNKYKLKRNRCSENHWYAIEKKKVKIAKSTIFISKKYATSIQNLFETVTNQIKTPEPKSLILTHLDGTIYYFSYNNSKDSILTGEIWSPRPNSSMSELVIICDKLVTIASDKNMDKERLLNDIETLTLKLID